MLCNPTVTNAFTNCLLKWYDQQGRKTLPWKSADPYRVWVSEIMLQQTQVVTVIPYFQRFMARFPTVADLANSALEDVLLHWQGLGYYARGRNLHKAAQLLHTTYGTDFPRTVEAWEALPGIGRSTAGAIVAQSFNTFAVILDANVQRVLLRFYAPTHITLTELWQIATAHTPQQRTADYTQAMMDLGATICTTRNPKCTQCPVQTGCRAYASGMLEQVPTKIAKTKIKQKLRTGYFLVFHHKNKLFLEQRPPSGIWGGLFALPWFESMTELESFLSNSKIKMQSLHPLWEMNHTFTHFKLTLKFIEVIVSPHAPLPVLPGQWYKETQLQGVGLPTPIQKFLHRYYHHYAKNGILSEA